MMFAEAINYIGSIGDKGKVIFINIYNIYIIPTIYVHIHIGKYRDI